MDLGLRDKVVLITGGSKGIGKACARLFAEEGAKVVVAARGVELLKQVATQIQQDTGAEVLPIAGDCTQTADLGRVVKTTLDWFGRLDVLVTCAGSSPGGLLEELTEEQWMSSLQLKFMGYVRSCRAVIPVMRQQGGGRIVLVVGNDGIKPSYWEMTAGAANAADLNFCHCLAEQYGKENILVNAVNPGPVNTDRWDGLEAAFARDKKVSREEAHALALKSIPLGRICEPEEVANVVAFLASSRASFLNGAMIPIDGGQRKAIMDT